MTVTVRARTLVAGALAVVALVATGAVAGATLAPRIVAPATAFPDVPAGAFYTAAVQWAKDNGITTGVGDTGLFQPDAGVTRGQMVTFLERLAGSEIVISDSPTNMLPNAGLPADVSNWADRAEVSSAGIVQLALTGPSERTGIRYGLQSLEYCIESVDRTVSYAAVWVPGQGGVIDGTDRTSDGCYSLEVGQPRATTFYLGFGGLGAVDSTRIAEVRTTWVPIDDLAPAAVTPAELIDPELAVATG